MKKIVLMVVALAGSLAFAAANDTILAFSTKGPDVYKDGSQVLDGEYYAIVWTANGATFGGFAADGSLVSTTDKLLLVAPLAQGGKCPMTVLQIDANDAKGYADGTFALYLLDTRVLSAEKKAKIGKLTMKNGQASGVINAIAKAADSVEDSLSGGSVKMSEVGVYSTIGEPTIVGFKVVDSTIELTVKDLCEAADYFVVPGRAVGQFGEALDVRPQGNTFKFKASADDKFFKVIGVRKFQ